MSALASVDVVGAGYISALICKDDLLAADFRRGFTDTELLEAVTAPLRTLVTYLVMALNVVDVTEHEHTSTEVGDALIKSYVRLAMDGPARNREVE